MRSVLERIKYACSLISESRLASIFFLFAKFNRFCLENKFNSLSTKTILYLGVEFLEFSIGVLVQRKHGMHRINAVDHVDGHFDHG